MSIYKAPTDKEREDAVQRSRQWRIDNPGAHREYMRQYQIDNSEKLREYKRQWRIDNPEKPEKATANRARRRARRRNQMGEWNVPEPEFIQSLIESTPNCHYCSSPLNGVYHLEHMTPLSRGGMHEPSNLTLACPSCNLRKHTKTAEEFLCNIPD